MKNVSSIGVLAGLVTMAVLKGNSGSVNAGFFEPQSLEQLITRSKYKKTREKVTHLKLSRKKLIEFKGIFYGEYPDDFKIPEQIGLFSNLVELDLSDLGLKQIPESISNLQKLEKIHLHRNRLTEIPSFFSLMKNLSYVNLNENLITEIQPERLNVNFKKGWELKENQNSSDFGVIGLQRNNIERIPDDYVSTLGLKVDRILLGGNNKLKDMTDDQINYFLDEGMNPAVLAGACKDHNYTSSFEWTVNRILEHKNDRLWKLAIGYFGSRVRINLTLNKYADIDEYKEKVIDAISVLSETTNIVEMELTGPKIENQAVFGLDVSEVFKNYGKLESITFKDFTGLANLDSLRSLKTLTSISIDEGIKYNIEDLCNLEQLEYLTLGGKYVIIPPCFENLKNLKKLYIGGVVKIPEEFFNLINLKEFGDLDYLRYSRRKPERPDVAHIVKAVQNGFSYEIAKEILRSIPEPTVKSQLRRF